MTQDTKNATPDISALIAQGWIYKDLNWVKADLFQYIVELYGEDKKDIIVLITTQRTKEFVFQRGQFLVSPDAQKRFEAWYHDGGLQRLRLEHPDWFGDDLSVIH